MARIAAPVALLAIVLCTGSASSADKPAGEPLIRSLRDGGFTIYFRHAATDWNTSDRVDEDGGWKSCDRDRMRQLSESGRTSARRVGKALKALDIPVAKILSSEYCRAAETARLLGAGPVETTRDIMNLRSAEYVGGRDAAIARARRILSHQPPAGTNVVMVGHGNLLKAATGAYPGEGGAGLFRPSPDNAGGFEIVAMLTPEDWDRLAAEFAQRPARPH